MSSGEADLSKRAAAHKVTAHDAYAASRKRHFEIPLTTPHEPTVTTGLLAHQPCLARAAIFLALLLVPVTAATTPDSADCAELAHVDRRIARTHTLKTDARVMTVVGGALVLLGTGLLMSETRTSSSNGTISSSSDPGERTGWGGLTLSIALPATLVGAISFPVFDSRERSLLRQRASLEPGCRQAHHAGQE